MEPNFARGVENNPKLPNVFDTNIKIRNFTKVRRAGNTLKLQPEFVIAC